MHWNGLTTKNVHWRAGRKEFMITEYSCERFWFVFGNVIILVSFFVVSARYLPSLSRIFNLNAATKTMDEHRNHVCQSINIYIHVYAYTFNLYYLHFTMFRVLFFSIISQLRAIKDDTNSTANDVKWTGW